MEGGLKGGEKGDPVIVEACRATYRGDEITDEQLRMARKSAVTLQFYLSMLKRCSILTNGVLVIPTHYRNTRVWHHRRT